MPNSPLPCCAFAVHRTPIADEQKPVLRSLLLAHCVLQPQWGYFQGMSDIGCVALKAAADAGCPDVNAFGLLHGMLLHSADNWTSADLGGVWRQHRAMRAILQIVDRKLAQKLAYCDGQMGSTAEQMPYAFLFGAVFLRLQRELVSLEEAMRLWEVSWAIGGHFHIVVLVAFVRSQRRAIMRPGVGSAEVHQLFSRLHETQCAAPLLLAARALHAKRGVSEALEQAMAAAPTRGPTTSGTRNQVL